MHTCLCAWHNSKAHAVQQVRELGGKGMESTGGRERRRKVREGETAEK